MKPFTLHKGIVATLDRANVDTDQIIPKQFLKRIERTGFGEFLFFDWRYLDNQQLNHDFPLNRPEVRGASILVSRRNFGSGSSREHAVWALDDYGFRAVIAPSFADIFFNNCFKNGLLPILLAEGAIDELFARATGAFAERKSMQLTIDLAQQRLTDDAGFSETFSIDPFRKECLLQGLDDIALTLLHEDKISEYERACEN
jgi:3-isopropylmalate/(R)-2-methylmalate dehydratase small subunit